MDKPDPLPKTYGTMRSVRLRGQDYGVEKLCISVTWCVAERHPLFAHPQQAALACQELINSANLLGFTLWAACVMPDHIHALIENAKGERPVGDFVSSAKHSIRKHVIPEIRWQKKFHDHILRPWEDPRMKAVYIVNNPVRAAMAKDWRDWPGTYCHPDAL